MTSQMIHDTTVEFYSKFCCIHLSQMEKQNWFVCSEERGEVLKGYGCRYTVYILVKDGRFIAAFSPEYRAVFEPWKQCGVSELLTAANWRFRLKKLQLMIFDHETVTDFGAARILHADDYPQYEAFFRETRPGVDAGGWLKDYFMEKAGKEYFAGYFLDGALVSVADAPDMPYLEGRIQHTGVHTLARERRRGYAARTAALASHHLLERNICPQWECSADNLASVALAESIGYKPYAQAYVLEE